MADLAEILVPRPTHKRCARCQEWLPLEAFSRNVRLRDGHNSWCRRCQVQRTQQWRAENPDYLKAVNDRRRKEPEVRSCVECGTGFSAGRKDRVLCSHNCKVRRARRLNPELQHIKDVANSHRRRVHIRRVPELRIIDVGRLLKSRTFCPLCRKKMTDGAGPFQKHLDHIVPLNVGGTHTWTNVRIICRTCNLRRPKDGSDILQEALFARTARA